MIIFDMKLLLKIILKIIKTSINLLACILLIIIPVPLMLIVYSIVSILNWALTNEEIKKEDLVDFIGDTLKPIKSCIDQIKTVWNG